MDHSDIEAMLAAAGVTQSEQEEDTFYVEDICSLGSDLHCIGVIERTTGDIDSHASNPQSDYPGLTHHEAISKAAFRKFKQSGIPPAKTVLVAWQSERPPELIPTQQLKLQDRSLIVGDIVKRKANDSMSGTVTQTSMLCMVCPSSFKDSKSQNDEIGMLPSDGREPFLVSANELQHATKYHEGDLVIFESWIGRIHDIFDSISIRLSNGSIVEVVDSAELEHPFDLDFDRWDVGDIVKTKKSSLRRGTWKVGHYDPSILPKGDVVQVMPTHIRITWLWNHASPQPLYDRSNEPSGHMEICDFERLGGKLYDASRSPIGTTNHPSHLPFMSGDKVRFKDAAGAAMKYPRFRRIPPGETNGFDLNVLTIYLTKTKANILWQDQNEDCLLATSVVPDYNIDDDSEVWPADIVCTKEAVPVLNEDWIFQPKRVGIVQSVSPPDRVARVKWLPNAHIQYNQIGLDEHLEELSLLSGSTLGLDQCIDAECPIEEVTLYDIRTLGAISRRRGDYVVLAKPENENDGTEVDKRTTGDIDWFGEVLDLNLDGTLTVRLGAAKQVQDIRVSPELTKLVHSSDSPSVNPNDSLDEWSGTDDGLSDDSESSSNSEGSEVVSDEGTWFVDGKPIDPQDDEEWEDEDVMSDLDSEDAESVTDEDVEMADDPPLSTAPNSTGESDTSRWIQLEHAVPLSALQELDGAPASFDILDTEPPPFHSYLLPEPPALTGTRMKRIRKEHTILQSALPEGVFVRTWESRLDLLRVLIVGPLDTPYEYAPFVIDLRIPGNYPSSPPDAFFHSWTSGHGPVNPNLYENGRICLSLLGTWPGERGEAWSAKSTILQVLVSLLGLVLVKEPYFNEAGFEARAGSDDAKIPSQLYSERTYFKSRAFIAHAIQNSVHSFENIVKWLYTESGETTPRLLAKAIDAARELVQAGDGGTDIRAGLQKMSKGAIIMLQRQLTILESLNPQ